MNKWFYTSLAIFALIALFVTTNLTHVFADGTVSWNGINGLDSENCSTTNYIHWVFTTGGNDTVTAATLTLGGTGSGSYTMTQQGQGSGSWQYTTSFYTLNGLTASVAYTGSLGDGTPKLTISDYCPGSTTPTPTPTGVQPTVTPTPTIICDNEDKCDPTATPTPTGTVTVTDTPTPTPTTTSNGGGGNGGGDGLGCATHDCSTHSNPTQAVLGASTMATTGTFEENAMNLAAVAGIILMGLSVYGQKAKKALFN